MLWSGENNGSYASNREFFLKCDSEWKKAGETMTISEGETRVTSCVTGCGRPEVIYFFLETSETKLTHGDKPFSKCLWKHIYDFKCLLL